MLGAALRFAWVFHNGFGVIQSEGFFEAAAFATKGELADAYGPGYRSYRPSFAWNAVACWDDLSFAWSWHADRRIHLVMSFACFHLYKNSSLALDAAFERLYVAPVARLSAIAILALIPLNIFFEMKGFDTGRAHWRRQASRSI